MKHAIARPPRRLTSTERAERYGMPRPTEAQARAARVARMRAVLDRAWWATNPGRRIVESGLTMQAVLRQWTPEQWHALAQQADPDRRVEPPSQKTIDAVLAIVEERADEYSRWIECDPEVSIEPQVICSVCLGSHCHSVNCAEEAGIRGKDRYLVVEPRLAVVRDEVGRVA